MSKICHRLNNKLLAVLVQINEEAKQVDGFSHLSHSVQFEAQQLRVAQSSHAETKLQKQLHKLLFKKGIVLKDLKMNLKLQGPA